MFHNCVPHTCGLLVEEGNPAFPPQPQSHTPPLVPDLAIVWLESVIKSNSSSSRKLLISVTLFAC